MTKTIDFKEIFSGKYDRIELQNRYKLKKIASKQIRPITRLVIIPWADWQKK